MQEPTISTKPIAENRSSYKSWVASEGIPIIQGFFIEDIREGCTRTLAAHWRPGGADLS